jgi:hypothetical protein
MVWMPFVAGLLEAEDILAEKADNLRILQL